MFGPTDLGAVYDSGSALVSPTGAGYCRGGDEIASRFARSYLHVRRSDQFSFVGNPASSTWRVFERL